jgi:hypothetical protein
MVESANMKIGVYASHNRASITVWHHPSHNAAATTASTQKMGLRIPKS